MNFSYKFNKEECWYKEVCPFYKKEKCCESCVRYIKMYYLVNNALLSKKQQCPIKLYAEPIDEENFKILASIKKNIFSFVKDGKNLLLYSKITGNGKTAWALKLLLSYFNKIWAEDDFTVRGMFINIPRFFNAIKEDIRESQEYVKHIRDNVLKADIIVWDELGVKTLTPYEHDYLLSYINARLDAGKSNIFTSNLKETELFEILGNRLYSRIINSSQLIELKGKDKRGLYD